MIKRLYWLGALFSCLLLLIIGRLAYIQLYQSADLAAASAKMKTTFISLEQYTRGDILDRNHRSLLNQNESLALIILPSLLENPQDVINTLNAHFAEKGIQLEDLQIKSNGQYPPPIIIPLNENQLQFFSSTTVSSGIVLAPYHWRYNQPLAVHSIGYVNHDGHGVSGLEGYYDDVLFAKSPSDWLTYTSDAKDNPLQSNGKKIVTSAQNHRYNLVTTLDYDIQSLLENTMNHFNVSKGAAIITEVASNQIVAAASRPIYNPLDLTQTYGFNDNHFNKALGNTYRYYPGSIFKIVTALAALEEDVLDANAQFTCDNLPPYNKCPRIHGEIDLQQALKASCNNYFIHLGHVLGSSKLHYYVCDLLQFHLDKNKKFDSDTAIANGVLGQELLRVSPLQMVRLISVVANNGLVYVNNAPWQEQLALGISDRNNLQPFAEQGKLQRVFSTETVATLQKALSNRAVIDGLSITYAGKTGTPEIVDADGNKTYLAWYIGYFPADNPQYAIAIVIEEISGLSSVDLSGGRYALPIFLHLAVALSNNG